MMRFEVQLLPQATGRWAARLTTGAILSTEIRRPRVEVASLLLKMGADPRSQMVIRSGAEIIAFDTLGRATGLRPSCQEPVNDLDPA